MKVLNIHERTIAQSSDHIVPLLASLASKNDLVWPYEQWPRMRFKDGIKIGAIGGHGPIVYEIVSFDPHSAIVFKFHEPRGFVGTHCLELEARGEEATMLRHTIDMRLKGRARWIWLLAIRWLHDALIEDAFDKVENYFTSKKKRSKWNLWVRFLRTILK